MTTVSQDDPRKGIYEGLLRYRGSCDKCEWHGRWHDFRTDAEQDSMRHKLAHIKEGR